MHSKTGRRAFGSLVLVGLASAPVRAQEVPVQLFRVVGPRDEITIGVTATELAALGSGPEVERLARKLVADGQLTAWQYVVGRAPDGSTRYATARRVAVLRSESLRLEPLVPAIPVAPPPAR